MTLIFSFIVHFDSFLIFKIFIFNFLFYLGFLSFSCFIVFLGYFQYFCILLVAVSIFLEYCFCFYFSNIFSALFNFSFQKYFHDFKKTRCINTCLYAYIFLFSHLSCPFIDRFSFVCFLQLLSAAVLNHLILIDLP